MRRTRPARSFYYGLFNSNRSIKIEFVKMLHSTRFRIGVTLFILCVLGILTKYYRGPFWRIVDGSLADILIVMFLYFCIIFIWKSIAPVYPAVSVFCYALFIEFFQLTGIPQSWRLPPPWVHIFGSKFDVTDVFAYAIGITLAVLLDICILRKSPPKRHSS